MPQSPQEYYFRKIIQETQNTNIYDVTVLDAICYQCLLVPGCFEIPACDFSDEKETPAQTDVTKEQIKDWIGKEVYMGEYRDRNRTGRCKNSEMKMGIIWKCETNRNNIDVIFILFPVSGIILHLSLECILLAFQEGHMFTKEYLEKIVAQDGNVDYLSNRNVVIFFVFLLFLLILSNILV